MKIKLQRKNEAIAASFNLSGDKSIAHRALIIGALAKGSYKISNFPFSLDCLTTLGSIKQLGVDIIHEGTNIYVTSPGYENFITSPGRINANNSGTTARLMCGLLSGCNIECIIDGDLSLRKRPMTRIELPLKQMGAKIISSNGVLPITIEKSSKLKGISYSLPVDSAQVKSCILIAGFLSEGVTTVIEKNYTRDHTEKLFKALGASIDVNGKHINIKSSNIKPKDISIPGDISSAAFLIGCTLLSKNAKVKLNNILLNERRRKYLDILRLMGAELEYSITHKYNEEEVGYIEARSSHMSGITISKDIIPNIIDEIPILSILAAFSNGKTVFQGVDELRFKESNRISSIVENLRKVDIDVQYLQDSIEITGNDSVVNKDIYIYPYNDHRIALAFAALATRNSGSTVIDNWEFTDISFKNSINYLSEFLNICTTF